MPSLAVVVIRRNEASNLDRCFASVQAMEHPAGEVELIYVDSASTDGSQEVARRWGARLIVLDHQPPTASRGRDLGWRASTAAYLLFLDGDCSVDPGFVTRGLREFQDLRVAAVWGVLKELHPEASLYNRMNELLYQGLPEGPGLMKGGNYLLRRSALEAVGGFDHSLAALESAELCRRLWDNGYVLFHVRAPAVIHNANIVRFHQYFRRGFRYGYGDADFLTRVPEGRRNFRQHPNLAERLTDLMLFLPVLFGLLTAIALPSVTRFCLAGVLFLAVIVLKIWRVRRRAAGLGTLAIYALHVQLQSVAVAAGYVVYVIRRLAGHNDIYQPRAAFSSFALTSNPGNRTSGKQALPDNS